jgi:hypothetical protein
VDSHNHVALRFTISMYNSEYSKPKNKETEKSETYIWSATFSCSLWEASSSDVIGWLWLSREHAAAFCFTLIVLSHLSDACGERVVQELDGAVRFKVGSVS